jgi:hypothetical protein
MFQRYTGEAPESTLSEEERDRRIAEELEARERWNRDIQEGKHAREARRRAREAAEHGHIPEGRQGTPAQAAPVGESVSTWPPPAPRDSAPMTGYPNQDARFATCTDAARAAWQAGQTVFQLVLSLEVAAARGVPTPPPAGPPSVSDHNAVLNAVEGQGWRLEHASFVSTAVPSVSPDASWQGGDHAARDIVAAIYIFRRVG